MKKILITFILLFSFSLAFGQVTKNNVYLKSEGLEKFDGRWEANSGKYSITFIFQSKKRPIEGFKNAFRDISLGWYQYSINDNLIYDNLSNIGSELENADLVANIGDKAKILNIYMVDQKRGIGLIGELKLSPVNPTLGVLKLRSSQGVRINQKEAETDNLLPIPSTWKIEKVE